MNNAMGFNTVAWTLLSGLFILMRLQRHRCPRVGSEGSQIDGNTSTSPLCSIDKVSSYAYLATHLVRMVVSLATGLPSVDPAPVPSL